jgi:hypothetical protein
MTANVKRLVSDLPFQIEQMPINFELVNNSIAHLKSRMDARISTNCPDLWFLEDFLYVPLKDKLWEFISGIGKQEWSIMPEQSALSRRYINWQPDTVIEETHMVLESATRHLESLLDRSLKFHGISIWRDEFPYRIDKHSDQPGIACALQIYINSTDANLATHFEHGLEILAPEYKTNSGYLMDNKSKIIHWVPDRVPKSFIRYSLYATWGER